MKRKVIFILLLGLASWYSCKHRNLMKINEEAIAEKILEEETRNLAAQSSPASAGNGSDTYPGPIRLQEDRSTDKDRPPALLDVASSRKNLKSFSLSDFARSIRYIRLETPPDSNLLALVEHYQVTRNAIITDGINGIGVFSRNGDFIETVSRNSLNFSFSDRAMFTFSRAEVEGKSPFSHLSVFGEQIFYRYDIGSQNLSRAVSYSLPDQPVLTIPEAEKNISPFGKGETRKEFKGEMFSNYSTLHGLGNNLWAGMHSKMNSGTSGNLLVIYNERGDTLCEFPDYQQIGMLQGGTFRTQADNSFQYYYRELLTLKPQYQDTIFRVIPPNRLLPVYVIDFGSHKATPWEGFTPRFDLSEKWLSYSLVETRDFLFYIYTENYVCPANLRNKSVTFYRTVFDKQEGTFCQCGPETYEKTGIENDLDGGYPFWPDLSTPDDELVMLITGKEFRAYINSDAFRNRTIPEEQREKQLSIARSLSDQDQLLIMVSH